MLGCLCLSGWRWHSQCCSCLFESKQKINKLKVDTARAVKRFLSSRLIMNSRRFWNSHQRHKLLENQGIWEHFEIQSFEMAFPEVFKRYFPLVSSEYTKTGNNAFEMSQAFHRHRTVQTFHRSNPVYICVQCHSKLGNGCFTILFDGAYVSLAVWYMQKDMKVAS